MAEMKILKRSRATAKIDVKAVSAKAFTPGKWYRASLADPQAKKAPRGLKFQSSANHTRDFKHPSNS